MKVQKTNAMRQLDKLDIRYEVLQYDTTDGAIDGVSVAGKIGRSPESVCKTLAACGAGGGVYIFCVPARDELNLKRAARAAGEKSVAMLPLAQLEPVTGYRRGGVSPFAMKKSYPTFLAAEAAACEFIVVSAGRIGLQVELRPQDLLEAIGATVF